MGMGRTYVIGSFNVCGLSRSTCTRQRGLMIGQIIRHEQMDLVALQEVADPDALLPIVSSLGEGWSFSWMYARTKRWGLDMGNDPGGEGYAFLWNKSRLKRIETTLLDGSRELYEPCIYQNYRVDERAGQRELIRDPALGRFTPQGLGGGSFELRLLCTHIRYDGLRGASDRFGWKKRQEEFELLSRTILPKLEDTIYGDQMPSYTLLLGDYNMNLCRFWTKKPYLEEPPEGYRLGDKLIITVQDQLTTLKDAKAREDGGLETTVGYQNGFDHFSYNKNRFDHLHPLVGRCDIVNDGYYVGYFGDYDRYRNEISDHIPVVIRLQG